MKNKLQQLENLIIPKLEVCETGKGGDFPLLVVAVSSLGSVSIVDILNYETANPNILNQADEYIDMEFEEAPGIYFVEFDIQGSGPDYNGEYDAWAVFKQVIKYKIEVEDKREKDWGGSFPYKIYNREGSEYPDCLFVVDSSGSTHILDILNEEKAYSIVMNEIPHSIENSKYNGSLIDTGVYKGKILSVGNMEYIFDEDDDTVNFIDVEKIELVLEEEQKC